MSLLLWLDLETTGSDERKDHILEVAAILTAEDDLEPILEGEWLVAPATNPTHWDQPFVDMHVQSRLIDDALFSGKPLWFVETALFQMMSEVDGSGDRWTLAGWEAVFDLYWVREQMPTVANLLNREVITISSILRVCEMTGISTPDYEPVNRARPDVQAALEAAQWFRDRP